MTSESSLWLKIPTSCPICFCQWTRCHFIAINIHFAHVLEVSHAYAWKGTFPWVKVKGKPTALELLKVTLSVSSKAVTNHPGQLCCSAPRQGHLLTLKDVTEVQPWALQQMWGRWNGLSQVSPVPVKHFELFTTWTQLSKAFVQLGDLQLSLAVSTCHCAAATGVMPSTMVHHTSSRASHPPVLGHLGCDSVLLGWFWVVLPVLWRWFLGGFGHPSTAALGCAELFGTQWGYLPSLAVPWAPLLGISPPVLSTALICSVKAESGWLWADLHTLWVLTLPSQPRALYHLLLWSSNTTSILFLRFFSLINIKKN